MPKRTLNQRERMKVMDLLREHLVFAPPPSEDYWYKEGWSDGKIVEAVGRADVDPGAVGYMRRELFGRSFQKFGPPKTVVENFSEAVTRKLEELESRVAELERHLSNRVTK